MSAEKAKGTRNDQIYPPARAAEKFIAYDGAGFSINGQRRFLSSGTIHFTRVPNELWRDRLLRMKQADFINVESYVFWNYHEPRENEWNFTGDADFEKFLTTAQDLGLTALVRVGPYACAEWESGGWPLWLRFKPSGNLRTADPEFLQWNDHWYDKILPIVAKHQINKGGNIIMLQVENEHPLGWGVVNNDPYFDYLREQVQKHHIEIPWFFSGLHHGASPAPDDLDTTRRINPWFSTEFWAGWFDSYGPVADKKLRAIDAANWTIMAHGGGGQNYYMLHGGSNFDSWSDDSTGSSYDFGAAIGQAGDLRPSYYKMKRANLLAQSFPEIIASGTAVLAEYKTAATGTNIEIVGARRGSGGTLVFLRNTGSETSTAILSDGTSLQLERYSTVALPRDVKIEKDVYVSSANLALLTMTKNTGVTTVVFYGQPGEVGSINLSALEKQVLSLTVPLDGIAETNLTLKTGALRILVVPQDLSLRTWRLGLPEQQVLVFGPAFVQEVTGSKDYPVITYERFTGQLATGQIAVYGAQGKSWHFATPTNCQLEACAAPVLGSWEMLPAFAPADTNYDDASWFVSKQPQQMGADGDNGSYAWYRTTISVTNAGFGKLNLKAKDNAMVFINGKLVDGKDGNYPMELAAGTNRLAVFVSQAGRNKGWGYRKPIAELSPKGILGDVALMLNSEEIKITGWKLRGGPGLDTAIWTNPAATFGWETPSATGGRPAFYHTTFTASTPSKLGVYPILRLKWTGLSRGMVWVNGHSLGRYPERIHVDSLYVPEVWLKAGQNDLVVFDENGASPDGIKLIVDPASREVVQTTSLIDAQSPFVLPQENPPRDLVKMNAGNLAWKRAATASNSLSQETATGFVTDGDPDTVWKAAGKTISPSTPKPWIAVDLGKPISMGLMEIVWDGKSRDYKYSVEGSTDGQTWIMIGDQTTAVLTSPDSPSELSRFNFKGETFRHVRVTIFAGRSLGIAEVRVFPFIKPDELLTRIPEIFKLAEQQYQFLLANLKTNSNQPRTYENGKLKAVGPKDWTCGFFPGSLWYLFEYTHDSAWKAAAQDYTARIESAKDYRGTHDLGFMLNCSYGNGYRITHNSAYRDVLIQGAHTLATRFSPQVGLIRSWDFGSWKYPVIIDNMMNLEFLVGVAREANEPHLRDIAISHADKTAKNHFRADASSFHLVDYDPASGESIVRQTHQGYADSSAWARGQAWGLYGYTTMFRETGKTNYLEQAQRIARFILNHPRLPSDKIPYWDFDAPNIPAAPRDASAAAVMASALIELSGFVDPNFAQHCRQLARQQLLSLSSADYLAKFGENGGFLLRHSVGSFPSNSEVDVPLNYADYYFLEALLRYRNVTLKP